MNLNSKIYIAGHRGLAGSAIVRELQRQGYTNLAMRTHAELDLEDAAATQRLFEQERPEIVFLAAAKVGGIHANNTYPVEFLMSNLQVEASICRAAFATRVKRLIFLGSSCIYPRDCPQPIKEEYLLTGPLEATNRAYALAKIAGIEMCWSYNRQYKTQYLAVMPTNLYGPGDNYHPENSHVIPALLRKFHEAKLNNSPTVTVWGTGTPKREFMYSEDMADACVYLMDLPDERFLPLLGQDRNDGLPPLVNIGVGEDLAIRELAEIVKSVTAYNGQIIFDPTKPDGTPRKLLDVTRLKAMGWMPSMPLHKGLASAYSEFVARG